MAVEQLPPNNIEAERAVLGAVLIDPASIHQLMYGIEPELSDNVLQPDSKIQNIHKLTADDVKSSSRTIMPLRSEKQAGDEKELETGFDENMARREAGRCLRCGLICYMHKPQKKSKAA